MANEHDAAFDALVFGKKSFSELLKDIYSNSKQKEKQITLLIEELRPLVKTIGDATVIVPLIKDYIDVGVKNDEILVKMAGIVQRALQSGGGDSTSLKDISQEELDALEDTYSCHNKKAASIEADINKIISAVPTTTQDQDEDITSK